MNLKQIATMALDEYDNEDVFWDEEDDAGIYEDPVQYVFEVKAQKKQSSEKRKKQNKTLKGEAKDSMLFSDALDSIVDNGNEAGQKQKNMKVFKFKVTIDAPKYAKRFGIELPDDSSDTIDSAFAQDAATVSVGRSASRYNGQSPWTRQQVQTPLEECRAENPLTCRFHGAQAIANDVEASVREAFRAAGRDFGGNVNVQIDRVRGSKMNCLISVTAPESDKEIVKQAMERFSQQPGVDVDSDDFEVDEDEHDMTTNAEFDYDQLDQNAKARWGMGEERPTEQEQSAEEPDTAEQPEAAAEAPAEQQPVSAEAASSRPRMSPELAQSLEQARQNLAFAQMMLQNAPESMRPMVQAMVDAQQRIVDSLTPAPTANVESETPAATETAVEAPAETASSQPQEEPVSEETRNNEASAIANIDDAVRVAHEAYNHTSAAALRDAIQGALEGNADDRNYLGRRLGEDSPVMRWIETQRNNDGLRDSAVERPTNGNLRESLERMNAEMENYSMNANGEITFNLPEELTQEQINDIVAQLQRQYGDGYQVTAERNGRGGWNFNMDRSISRNSAESVTRGLSMTGLDMTGHTVSGSDGEYSMTVGDDDVVSYTNSLRQRMPDAIIEPVRDAEGNWTIRIRPRPEQAGNASTRAGESTAAAQEVEPQREYTQAEHELRETLSNVVNETASNGNGNANRSSRHTQQDIEDALNRIAADFGQGASRDRIFRGINDAINGNANADVDAYLGQAENLLGNDNPIIQAIHTRMNGINRVQQQAAPAEEERVAETDHSGEEQEPAWRSMSHDSRAYWEARWNSDAHGDLTDPTDDELEHAIAVLGENDPIAREMMDSYNARHGTNIRNYHDAAVESGELDPEDQPQHAATQEEPHQETTNEPVAVAEERPRPSATPVVAQTDSQRTVAEAQEHERQPLWVSATPVASAYSAEQDQSPKKTTEVNDELKDGLIAEYNRAREEKRRLGQILLEQGLTTTDREGRTIPDFNNRESGAAMKARRYASYAAALGKVIGGRSDRKPKNQAERNAHPEWMGEDGKIHIPAGHELGSFATHGDMVNRMQSVMTAAFNAAQHHELGQGSTAYKRAKDAMRYLGSRLGANVTVDDSNGNLNVEWTDHPNNDTFDYGYINEDARPSASAAAPTAAAAPEPTVSARTEASAPTTRAPEAPSPAPTEQPQAAGNAAAESLARSLNNVRNPMARDILQRIQARAAGR